MPRLHGVKDRIRPPHWNTQAAVRAKTDNVPTEAQLRDLTMRMAEGWFLFKSVRVPSRWARFWAWLRSWRWGRREHLPKATLLIDRHKGKSDAA